MLCSSVAIWDVTISRLRSISTRSPRRFCSTSSRCVSTRSRSGSSRVSRGPPRRRGGGAATLPPRHPPPPQGAPARPLKRQVPVEPAAPRRIDQVQRLRGTADNEGGGAYCQRRQGGEAGRGDQGEGLQQRLQDFGAARLLA